ncbi:MAG: hypothetical protein K2Q26_10305 [Bdellovibrionales bacterium]|nr:hypothetical protein [Bdellovibrionales bacterium]
MGNNSGAGGSENAIKGAVLGGVVMGLTSYLLHESLEKRDANVRRETLMNLEHYDVLGVEKMSPGLSLGRSGRCFTTKEVDGRIVSLPCHYVNDSDEYGMNQ